ncbi:sodium:solute symporter [Gluconacetobacter takamatsuzukensis]|uniref:Sodium:proline symporter n=1 Tax=Gluconacetobacter takamatsuzukensis TaxID=1286190 RepID=A0A7W4PSU5_9PROT|nr:sodium:solute symporter [Gluconacetobacter takamatsuzukensis]MBB2205301.1 sodium:proline symporter [Gluconacetobacter takamatsuzukensis]
MRPADIAVIGLYFVVLLAVTLTMARRGRSAGDFLSAHHDLPWWALCLSLVATETSTLTFISVPGVGYTNGLVFAGLAGGYLIGRLVVAVWFLPLYIQGRMSSAYQYLGRRFGYRVQRIAAGAFLLTRLVAEGVRLLAGMLPLVWLLTHAGLPVGRGTVLVAIMAATLAYTLFGGLRAVVWSDSVQLVIYLFGAALCVGILWGGAGGWQAAWGAGRLALFHVHSGARWFADPFTPAAALLGGAILSVASHGTDQLMVQRLLAARSLQAARLALIGSAVLVGVLFTLLSVVGVQLWVRSGGAPLAALGFRSADELFPHFIVTGLPAGLSGLLVAGVLSATMGSLSATLNAMAGSVLTDFGPVPARVVARMAEACGWRAGPLFAARVLTAFWAVALVAVTMVLGGGTKSAVILGLTVAGWSYGPTLGAFLFGMLCPGGRERDAVVGVLVSLAGMAVLMGLAQRVGWTIAFPWLVPAGIGMMLAPACLSMMFRSSRRVGGTDSVAGK